jgi:hypothetical protein
MMKSSIAPPIPITFKGERDETLEIFTSRKMKKTTPSTKVEIDSTNRITMKLKISRPDILNIMNKWARDGSSRGFKNNIIKQSTISQ